MTWFLFALSAMALFTSLNLLQRKIAVDSQNPRATAIVFDSVAAFFALLLFLLTGSYKHLSLPTQPLAWAFLVIASLMYGLFERNRFKVAQLLDASTFAIIINISVVVGFVGSLILYSESLTVAKLLGSLLIITSLLLATYRKNKKITSSKGLFIAVGISILLGIGWTLDKKGVFYFTPEIYNILLWVFPLIVILFPFVKLRELKQEFKISSWRIMLLAGINVVGYWCNLQALNLAEATRVIPIIQTSLLFTVLLGMILFHEREHWPRKILATVLTLIGIYLLR